MKGFFNALQSFLLLGLIGLIFAVIGSLIAGMEGAAVAIIGCIVFFFLTPQVSPSMILRLYRARELVPEENPGLFRIIKQLTESAHLPAVPSLYYIPSVIMNAFSSGRKDKAVIAMTDGLIRSLTDDEMTGILAHEVGHIKRKDLWIMGLADLISSLTNIFSFIGMFFFILYFPAYLMGWVKFSLWTIVVFIISPYASALLQLALSRTREYEADVYAANLTGDPLALASALEKIEEYPVRVRDLIFMPGMRMPAPSILRTHPHTKKRTERLIWMAGRAGAVRRKS
jgi:heat shock protein HtpX